MKLHRLGVSAHSSFLFFSGSRFTLQTSKGSLPHHHWINLSSSHHHQSLRLPQEPSAPPPPCDVPSQSPPEPPHPHDSCLRRAAGEGAVGGPAAPGCLEDAVEEQPVQLPLLFTQPGLSQLPLHLFLPWTLPQPTSQEPLPPQEQLFHPFLPAQCGRSDRGGGDRRGHG